MNLRYTSQAKNEVDLAFEWYELQRRGLGFEFLDCLEASINNIIHFPELYGICHANFRRCVIRRFPFSNFYTIEKNQIVVHSVFDNRQNPNKLL
jgi:toxin ParE1/3/4